jgi:hypothetical protein
MPSSFRIGILYLLSALMTPLHLPECLGLMVLPPLDQASQEFHNDTHALGCG